MHYTYLNMLIFCSSQLECGPFMQGYYPSATSTTSDE